MRHAMDIDDSSPVTTKPQNVSHLVKQIQLEELSNCDIV